MFFVLLNVFFKLGEERERERERERETEIAIACINFRINLCNKCTEFSVTLYKLFSKNIIMLKYLFKNSELIHGKKNFAKIYRNTVARATQV